MGTHPSGPATLASNPEQTLKAWIQANPAALGDKVLKRFGVDLPYLFKVHTSSNSSSSSS
jgi:mannose-6-phosphate isomerase